MSGNLYGKGATDPDWPTSGAARTGAVTYQIEDGTLIVMGSKSAGRYELDQSAATITTAVEMLNAAANPRGTRKDIAYQESLKRYLTALMRRVADFYKGRKWNLVERALHDFEEREQCGCRHDIEGRELWKALKASQADLEDEGGGEHTLHI